MNDLPNPGAIMACGHDRLQMCEGGYVRVWDLVYDEDTDMWLACLGETSGDEGDGETWVECRTCLARYKMPEEFDYT